MKKKTFLSLMLALASLFCSAQGMAGFDFIVPRDGTFRQAIEAANNRHNLKKRFRIFVLQGTHTIEPKGTTIGGDKKEYADPRTHLTAPYTSIIGEDRDATVLVNTVPEPTWDNGFGRANPLEGIGRGDVLIIDSTAHHTYIQDITMKSGMGDNTGRNIVLNDWSTKTIVKNCCLWAYQDTYVSHHWNGRYYFEGGIIRGRTDYICGKGDVVYNGVTFQQCGKGGYLAVPSVPRKYGYVMLNCYIKSETPDVSYYLGRPWGKGTPTALFINTRCDAAPIAKGWADMSGGWPAQYAETGTRLTSGEAVDLSSRRTLYTDREGNNHTNNPIVSEKQVAELTVESVMGAEDHWNPQATIKKENKAKQKLMLMLGK